MDIIKVKIVNKSTNETPKYETFGSAGFDLRADISNSISLKSSERVLIKTGLFMEIPKGHVGYVCTRSGLALKKGLVVANSPGVVDSDYRQEIGVILINLSNEDIVIEHGDRVAQMVISKYEKIDFEVIDSVDKFEETERIGGFGSTGLN